MTQYAHYVGSTCQPVVGTMTWNANGSLGSLGTFNPFNSVGNDICNYEYDDLNRIKNAWCIGGWGQNFGYDAFGNITKSLLFDTSTGTTFQPTGYNSANQPLGVSMTFDANGNLTGELGRSYTWFADGTVASIGSTSLTYDALGRVVEQYNRLSGYTQTVYGPSGQKLALMEGQTLQKAFVPLPGGATAVYTSSGLSYYRHPDWLGSSRFASTPDRAMYSSTSYGPFGEAYNGEGATDLSFTGMNTDTVPDLYDFMYRKYSPVQSRWISPDPLGLQAVDTTKPQSWNRYAYVMNNPVNATDTLGLRQKPGGPYVTFMNPDDDGNIGGYGPTFDSGLYAAEYYSLDIYSGGSQYTLDGMVAPPEMVSAFLQNGSAVVCPNCGAGQYVGQDNTIYGWKPAGFYTYVTLDTQTGIYSRTPLYQYRLAGWYPIGVVSGTGLIGIGGQGGSGGQSGGASAGSLNQLQRLAKGFSALTHPLDMLAVNASMFVAAGGQIVGGGAAIVGGCLEPTPLEPATCAAGATAGGVLIPGGIATGAYGVYFFKNYTLPALKEW
jgi:RHS repeat-associated protein